MSFRSRAIRARALADKLNRPTAHESGMAQAFPLGAGFGRRGSTKRMERSIDRAVDAVAAEKEARYLESQAEAFDRGEIDARGRRIDAASCARSEKRASAKERREERIAAAQAVCANTPRELVSPETWADAAWALGGSGRALLMSEQREYIERWRAEGGEVEEQN